MGHHRARAQGFAPGELAKALLESQLRSLGGGAPAPALLHGNSLFQEELCEEGSAAAGGSGASTPCSGYADAGEEENVSPLPAAWAGVRTARSLEPSLLVQRYGSGGGGGAHVVGHHRGGPVSPTQVPAAAEEKLQRGREGGSGAAQLAAAPLLPALSEAGGSQAALLADLSNIPSGTVAASLKALASGRHRGQPATRQPLGRVNF